MTSLDEYRALVNTKISATLRPPDWLIPSAKDFFADFVQPAVALLTLGKRTRAAFLAAGWQLFATPKEASSPTHLQLPITAGAALELYQASALIHDDIIDAADSRRGLPAAHLAFAALHQSHDLDGSEKNSARIAQFSLAIIYFHLLRTHLNLPKLPIWQHCSEHASYIIP
ncbi:polyprenyl synthetase family protein [Arcanobacterium hippocoleae]|uniref:polyprenyl synthetase family protein n=1 Tax=Arcanobacterium hippocoleae TaxID=149017 RepID=UPI0033407D8C